jgi:hypothetical protein
MTTGTIYESPGSFYVWYSVGMRPERRAAPIQMSHRFCEKNDKYYSSKAREVKLLRYAFILTVDTRGHS